MRYDPTLPLIDQLADAAMASRDPTTRQLLTIVRGNLDDHVETFFMDPTGDNLTRLIGYWTRSVQLLKQTPDIATRTDVG